MTGFNGSVSPVPGTVGLDVTIGSWSGHGNFVVTSEGSQIIIGLPLLYQLGLVVDCVKDCLKDQGGKVVPCLPVSCDQEKN